ncbi:MAG: sodium:proton antiporter [Candidatus Cloacimonetes bacterium HGW-Cloacimonetes-3]|jgi:multicomponent Na+:H+ antiporter subunit B|nr:MAG: sodium:proton antiporter [Candidatus Cloacimonetes bacterium HGW-Cloacimonetes-3]
MIKYLLTFLALLGIGYMFFPLVMEFSTPTRLNPLAEAYVSSSVNDLNMPNVVTAIVVSYRGLDTLGEVTVLFLATAGVGFLLRKRNHEAIFRRQGSEILRIGASFLAPLIIVFGVYIFTHGHLSPGGGFQGGVVMASGILLMVLACKEFSFSHNLIHFVESLSGVGYVLMALTGLLLIGFDSFLDPRFLPKGEWLSLFSSGAVPIIYSLIGLKVGSELSSVIDSMQTGGEK